MNLQPALELLISARSASRRNSPSAAGVRPIPLFYLWESFMETEPFVRIRGATFLDEDGTTIPAEKAVRAWLTFAVGSDLPPDIVLQQASDDIALNSYEFTDVFRVGGITLPHSLVLSDEMTLRVQEDIPSELSKIFFLSPAFRGPWRPHPSEAFLCVERRHSPVFVPAGDATKLRSAQRRISEESKRREMAKKCLEAALLLCVDGPIDTSFRHLMCPRDSILMPRQLVHSPDAVRRRPSPIEIFQPGVLRSCFDNIGKRSTKDKQCIIRAAERLGSARAASDPVQSAADLGLALETILMHGSSDEKSEIGYKLRVRAAWLLGTNLDSRLTALVAAKRIYDCRSSAVHRGECSYFNMEEFNEFVTKTINAIVDAGEFPNWDELVCGSRIYENAACVSSKFD